jgi:hypothetical protein
MFLTAVYIRVRVVHFLYNIISTVTCEVPKLKIMAVHVAAFKIVKC